MGRSSGDRLSVPRFDVPMRMVSERCRRHQRSMARTGPGSAFERRAELLRRVLPDNPGRPE